MMITLPRIAFAALVCFLLSGCASSKRAFSGVGPDGEVNDAVRVTVATGPEIHAIFILSAFGEQDVEVDGLTTDRVRVDLTLDNLSGDLVELPLDQLSLKDDAGRTWRRAEIYGPQMPGEGTVLVIPANTRLSIGFGFDSGARNGLDATGSVTLEWEYRFRGAVTPHRTRFIPSPRTVYVERHYGVGVGYWHHRYHAW